MSKKKEKQYELSVFGFLNIVFNFDDVKAQQLLDSLELAGRRKGYENPAILLKGKDSEFIDVEYKKENVRNISHLFKKDRGKK